MCSLQQLIQSNASFSFFFNKDTTSQNIYSKNYSIISRRDQRKQYSFFFFLKKRSNQDGVSGEREQRRERCRKWDR